MLKKLAWLWDEILTVLEQGVNALHGTINERYVIFILSCGAKC